MINKSNYESFLVDYLHGELKGTLKQEMETLIAQDTEVAQEYELFKHTILETDDSIIYSGKEALYKTPQPAFSIHFKNYFAAASILLLAILGILFILQNRQGIPEQVALKPMTNTPMKKNTIITVPAPIASYQNNIANPISAPSTVNAKATGSIKNKSIVVTKSHTKPPAIQPQILQSEIQNFEQIVNEPEEEIAGETRSEPENKISSEIEGLAHNPNDTVVTNNIITEQPIHKGLVLNDKKNPLLFRAINQLSRLSGLVRNSKNRLANTELIVKVGNREIININ